jgi:hypothetical protein
MTRGVAGHHEPTPTTTAASNCSRGGWEVLTDGDTMGRTRDRADHGNDDMDTKRTTGSRNNSGNERTAGAKTVGKGKDQPHHT